MLRALPNVRQISGEQKRRWYFCHEQDLVVFEDEQGEFCGFQLAYDKHGRERSVTWQADRGFAHFSVEDGEATALQSNTPILQADDAFDCARVLAQFLKLADELPAGVRQFVASKLREFDSQTQH